MNPTRLAAVWLPALLGAAFAAVLAGAAVADAPLGVAVAGLAVRIAGVACVGTTLLLTLLPAAPTAEQVGLGAIRATVLAVGGWLLAALVAAAVGAAVAVDRPVAGLDADTAVRWVGQLPVGRGLLVTAGCALIVAVGVALWAAERTGAPPPVLLGVALVGVVAGPVTGHAADQRLHELAVLSFGLHAIAAAVWVGGLGAILALGAGRRKVLGELLERFAPLALACLATVAATGVLNAVIQLAGPGALLATGYGQLVLAKAGCLLAIAAIAIPVRRRLVAAGASVPALAGLAVAIMAVALGLAAALAASPPPP